MTKSYPSLSRMGEGDILDFLLGKHESFKVKNYKSKTSDELIKRPIKQKEKRRKPDENGRCRTSTGCWGQRLKAQYAESWAQVNNQPAPPQ